MILGGTGSAAWFNNQLAKLSAAPKTNAILMAIHVGPVEVFLSDCGKLRRLRSTRPVLQFMARLPFAFHPCVLDLRNLSIHRRNFDAEQKQRHPRLHWQRLSDHAAWLQINEVCGTRAWLHPCFGACCGFPANRV